jgi:hypothetical protein
MMILKATATMVDEHRLPSNVRVRWNKPPMGVMKINLNKETKIMGVGVVIQDDNEVFVVAFSKIVPYIDSCLACCTIGL